MPSLATILLAWGIVVPAIMWGWWTVDAAIDARRHAREVAKAVADTKAGETVICNGRVATIEKALRDEADKTRELVSAADARADELRGQLDAAKGDAAKLKAAVADLCRRSAACRDRASLK